MDTKFSEMSNAEITSRLKKLESLFNEKRKEIMNLCEEMKSLENEYILGQQELEVRKSIKS